MTDCNIFIYDETEVSYLKKRDKRLAEVIEKVGLIERAVIPDLFAALVNSIIGQQISTKGHKTIWKKMVVALGEITPQVIDSLSDEELQQFGITFKKVLTSNRQHKRYYRVNSTSNPLGQCRTKRSVPNS